MIIPPPRGPSPPGFGWAVALILAMPFGVVIAIAVLLALTGCAPTDPGLIWNIPADCCGPDIDWEFVIDSRCNLDNPPASCMRNTK